MDEFKISERRFKDLLLYISRRLADDPMLGETKVNKALFFIDFEAYRLLGTPVTGAEYQKNLYGPTARLYPSLRDQLLPDQLRLEYRQVGAQTQTVPIAEVIPNMEQFAPEEREIIDRVIDALRSYSNVGARDLSHERSVGWRVLELGETIPYQTAFIGSDPGSQGAVGELKRRIVTGDWTSIAA